MSHLPTLITDLALILASAGLMTLIFKRLKQPSVLGYIVAGILAGPHITLTPTVIDSGNIQTWADIGVVFLLFALGLEFSFKKLMKVGGPAIIAARLLGRVVVCRSDFVIDRTFFAGYRSQEKPFGRVSNPVERWIF